MNRVEVLELLQVAASYDSRKADRLQVDAFMEAARRAKWQRREAIEAVHEHYARSKEYLTPAHITERVSTSRRHPPRGAQLALPVANPATKDQRAGWLATIRQTLDNRKKKREERR